MATPLNASVLKSFLILNLISPHRPEISASVVADELNMSVGTAHRFLLTLARAGALKSYQRGIYSLGETIESLGRIAEDLNPVATKVQPIVNRLSRELGESVMACRLGRLGPTCIAVARADRAIAVDIKIGSVLPMKSAQGRLFLSQMDEKNRRNWLAGVSDPPTDEELDIISKQQYARNQGETLTGIGAVCVPLLSSSGKMILTISVFGMLSRFSDAEIAEFLPPLRREANAFTDSL